MPYRQGTYPTYYTTWTHPKTGKRNTHSLQETEENEAIQVYVDLRRLIETPAYWDLMPEDPQMEALRDRAVELFFGRPRQKLESSLEITIGPSAIGGKGRQFYAQKRGLRQPHRRIEVDFKEMDDLRQQKAESDRQRLRVEREYAELEQEAKQLRRKLNQHCKETLGKAVEKFERYYPDGHSPSDALRVIAIAKDFKEKTGTEYPLGEVSAKHVNDWLGSLKRKELKRKKPIRALQIRQDLHGKGKLSEPLAPPTKAKYKRYASVFLTWAYKTYDLSENPMDKTIDVPGVARYPENIIAIRRFEQLEGLLDGLEKRPYWHAWVAVAILAGPRWAEQAWLKVDDVYLDSHYLRIATRKSGKRPIGTKTGRERNVPLEGEILFSILKRYLADHPRNSPWLFPRLEKETGKPADGRWSSSSNFRKQWKEVRIAAANEATVKGDFWMYGPREWRHCAATAMGHSGCTEIQVSQWSDNSPDMVRRHYMAPVGAQTWPLKWG